MFATASKCHLSLTTATWISQEWLKDEPEVNDCIVQVQPSLTISRQNPAQGLRAAQQAA